MISRFDSLTLALQAAETTGRGNGTTIVFSRRWWDGLPSGDRESFRQRAEHLGVSLKSDSRITTHYVEMRGDDNAPLSSEQST